MKTSGVITAFGSEVHGEQPQNLSLTGQLAAADIDAHPASKFIWLQHVEMLSLSASKAQAIIRRSMTLDCMCVDWRWVLFDSMHNQAAR